ncbi:Sulfotransferase [Melia azedarach]|uniref:Sulfotransferase n=1 Tax=Melia azedarach TaxID=155640 RepID=A0ACC1X752_MELAZ|nr:Sulfotransferase [Melia azedarach]
MNFQEKDGWDSLSSINGKVSGTTWLKTLIPSIMNRDEENEGNDDDSRDPLVKNHPNMLIPSLELKIFRENPNPDLSGVVPFGPFHDHVLGYWKESLKRPEKILFLKYEDMKRDPRGQVKNSASFLGRPFVNEEGLEKVLWRCSLERLKNLEVNKSGIDPWEWLAYKSYFRLGLVGDWKNNLSTEMKQRLDEIQARSWKDLVWIFES